MKVFLRPLINRINRATTSLTNHIKTRWLQWTLPGFSAAGPVSFGRGVRIKITDGGRVCLGKNVCLDDYCLIYAQKGRIQIGDDVYLGQGTQVVAKKSIRIGDDCLIAPYTVIRDANHKTTYGKLIRQQGFDIRPVTLGRDCWLGSHVVVTAGATLGNGVVAGANAVVLGELPDNAIAAGAPARVVKYRQPEQAQKRPDKPA